MNPKFFSTAEFRAWLEVHHSAARELLVGLYRRESRSGMTYLAARKRVDAEAYSIRFTPRKPGSTPGLHAFREREERKAWERADAGSAKHTRIDLLNPNRK